MLLYSKSKEVPGDVQASFNRIVSKFLNDYSNVRLDWFDCGGYGHIKDNQNDHRKAYDGALERSGRRTSASRNLTHPYCDTD